MVEQAVALQELLIGQIRDVGRVAAGDIPIAVVREQLSALGIEITEAVINMIEGAVWEINTETKKAQVQTKEIVSANVDALAEAVTQEVLARLPGQMHE